MEDSIACHIIDYKADASFYMLYYIFYIYYIYNHNILYTQSSELSCGMQYYLLRSRNTVKIRSKILKNHDIQVGRNQSRYVLETFL